MSAEPLYGFQDSAVQQIVRGDQVYLGFDPGLGKSRTALEAAMRRGATRILVTCPASGRYVWEEQVRLWSHYTPKQVLDAKDLSGDGVFILTYGLISQAGSQFPAAVMRGRAFHMAILDEAAALKNPGSNRTKAVLEKMKPALGYVLPLSGTPAPNHAGELYPILRALYPKALKTNGSEPLRQWEFEDLFCNVRLKKFGRERPIRVIEGSRNLAELRRRLDGFMLRVRKEAVLKDLPAIRYDTVPLGVDRFLAAQIPTLPTFETDADMLKYLNGKIGDEHVMRLRRHLGACKVNPSIEYIDDFLVNLPEAKKVLVFAHHREVIQKLMAGLQNWSPVSITGASTASEREAAVNTFLNNERCRLFIGNIQASGTGLTLVGPKCACSDVIFVEASYSAGDNVQAAARIHRIGQREAVVARFLTAHQTIDDRIQSILTRKAHDFSALFN